MGFSSILREKFSGFFTRFDGPWGRAKRPAVTDDNPVKERCQQGRRERETAKKGRRPSLTVFGSKGLTFHGKTNIIFSVFLENYGDFNLSSKSAPPCRTTR